MFFFVRGRKATAGSAESSVRACMDGQIKQGSGGCKDIAALHARVSHENQPHGVFGSRPPQATICTRTGRQQGRLPELKPKARDCGRFVAVRWAGARLLKIEDSFHPLQNK